MSRLSKVKKKHKLNIIICSFVAIVTVVAVTIATFGKKTSDSIETSEIQDSQEIQEVEDTKVADVLDSNIQFDYNTDPTEKSIDLNIKEYDNSYNLYYYILEVGQDYKDEKSLDIDDTEESDYVIYNNKPIQIEKNSIVSFKYEKNNIFSENAYRLKITNIIDKGEIKEGATEEELKKEKVDKKDKSNNTQPYYIKVNYSANCVTVYKKDDNGDYTIPVKAMICSTGRATPTSGVYKISNRYAWRILVGGVYGQYATRIVGSILFHSVPYFSANHNALEYFEYDKLGTKASAGCVRLTVADAKWIYDCCSSGTMVEFYSDSNPGPLGKPGARKISNVTECRDWDPTDPVASNPWKTWNGKTNQKQTNQNNKTSTNNSSNKTNTTNSSTETNTNNNSNITNTNNNTANNNTDNTNSNVTNTNTNTNTDTVGDE